MKALSRAEFKEIFRKTAAGDEQATYFLIQLINENMVTAKAYQILARFLMELRQRKAANDVNLLFLEGVLQIFQKGAHHPQALNLLRIAQKRGHAGAVALLVYIEILDTAEWVHSKAADKEIKHLKSVGHWLQIYLPRKAKQQLKDFFKENSKNDLAIMHTWATLCFDDALNADKKIIDPLKRQTTIKHYLKLGYSWLNGAIKRGDVFARVRRHVITQTMKRTIAKQDTDYDIADVEMIAKEYEIKDYDIKEGLLDLEAALTLEAYGICEFQNKITLTGTEPCPGDVREYFVVAARKLRQANLAPTLEKKAKKKNERMLEIMLDHLQKPTGNDDTTYRPRAIYHIMMALNKKSILPFFWRRRISGYFKNSCLQNGDFRQVLQCVMEDTLLDDKQKQYFLKELLTYYVTQLKQAGDAATLADYQVFLNGLDLLQGLAEDQATLNLALKFYEEIPLQVKTASVYAEAQAHLADYYYSAALNSGHDAVAAYQLIESYQKKAKLAFIMASSQSEEPSTKFAFYRTIMEEREKRAKGINRLDASHYIQQIEAVTGHGYTMDTPTKIQQMLSAPEIIVTQKKLPENNEATPSNQPSYLASWQQTLQLFFNRLSKFSLKELITQTFFTKSKKQSTNYQPSFFQTAKQSHDEIWTSTDPINEVTKKDKHISEKKALLF